MLPSLRLGHFGNKKERVPGGPTLKTRFGYEGVLNRQVKYSDLPLWRKVEGQMQG